MFGERKQPVLSGINRELYCLLFICVRNILWTSVKIDPNPDSSARINHNNANDDDDDDDDDDDGGGDNEDNEGL